MFKEIDKSFGISVSHYSKRMHYKIEMSKFATRQFYGQFSMTIFSFFSITRIPLIDLTLMKM